MEYITIVEGSTEQFSAVLTAMAKDGWRLHSFQIASHPTVHAHMYVGVLYKEEPAANVKHNTVGGGQSRFNDLRPRGSAGKSGDEIKKAARRPFG